VVAAVAGARRFCAARGGVEQDIGAGIISLTSAVGSGVYLVPAFGGAAFWVRSDWISRRPAWSATCFTRASRARATRGGPSSSTERQLIDLWLAQPRLELEEPRMLMRMLFDEHPVLNDLVAARATAAGPEVHAQLDGIMQRFAADDERTRNLGDGGSVPLICPTCQSVRARKNG
jgi:hypothetical protein